MITCFIDDIKLQNSILKYLLDNIIYISKSSYNDKEITNICVSHSHTNEYNYILFLGKHIFNFEGNNLEINYYEQGYPLFTQYKIDIYKRLNIIADNKNIIDIFLNKVKYNSSDSLNDNNIFICNHYGEWIKINKLPSRDLNTIYINNKIKDKIVYGIEKFLSSEKEYDLFGIPYKITFLLNGIPGSGKTSLIKAICNKFNFSLCMLSLSKQFDNDSLTFSIKNLEERSILLIEDIDSIFNKRESADDNSSISFSNLLNILDGFLYKHGSIIFITTNHPEKLDDALLRIGRIDSIIELKYPNKNDIKLLFTDLMKTCYDDLENIDNEFNLFYNSIKNINICMSAIVNFLFKYKTDWNKNIDELLYNNSYISKILGNENKSLLFT
jgi:chaperone BCS1